MGSQQHLVLFCGQGLSLVTIRVRVAVVEPEGDPLPQVHTHAQGRVGDGHARTFRVVLLVH